MRPKRVPKTKKKVAIKIPNQEENYQARIQIELAIVLNELAIVRTELAIVQTGYSSDRTSKSSS